VSARDLGALLEVLHPDIELGSLAFGARREMYRGHVGIRRWWQVFTRTYARAEFVPERIVVEGDRAVIVLRTSFVAGGVPVETPGWQAARFADGKLRWWVRFASLEEACAAVDIAADQ
jgi:ketosteroid isomerase-like protein